MIQVSKVVLSSSILLAILVIALEFNGCESGPFDRTTVEMTNRLDGLHLKFHCKDKHNDLGPQILDVGGSWSFSFWPDFFAQKTLFFCHFGWYGGGDEWFDIYIQARDQPLGDSHHWEIFETGPCRVSEERECFPWNDSKGISGGRHLGDVRNNNTIGV